MNTSQIHDAIRQMRVHCQLQIEVKNWETTSAREVLGLLGYNITQTEAVLQFIYDAGFTNCLDRIFPSSIRGDELTPDFATYWAPDQLLDRLESLHHTAVTI